MCLLHFVIYFSQCCKMVAEGNTTAKLHLMKKCVCVKLLVRYLEFFCLSIYDARHVANGDLVCVCVRAHAYCCQVVVRVMCY